MNTTILVMSPLSDSTAFNEISTQTVQDLNSIYKYESRLA